jgi:uncharacterized protein YbcI
LRERETGRSTEPPAAGRDGNVLAAISDEIVKLYKEQFGRGPMRARTFWAGKDMLVVVLEETFTPAERRMRQMGEHQRLRDHRMFFQYASVRQFVEPVERLTGRRVKAFISGMDTEEDVAVENFVLHPEGSTAPSRIAKAEPPVDPATD